MDRGKGSGRIVLLATLLVALLAAPTANAATGWESPFVLTTVPGAFTPTTVVTPKGDVYEFWQEFNGIGWTRRAAGSASFSDPAHLPGTANNGSLLTAASDAAGNVTVAVSGGGPYGGPETVTFDPSGTPGQPDVVDDTDANYTLTSLSVAGDGRAVIGYERTISPETNRATVAVRASVAGGFGTPQSVSPSATWTLGFATDPNVQTGIDTAGDAVAAWQESTDSGATQRLRWAYRPAGAATTFGPEQELGTDRPAGSYTPGCADRAPRVAMSTDGVAFAEWADSDCISTSFEYAARRPAGDATSFGTPQDLGGVYNAPPMRLLAMTGGGAMLVYEHNDYLDPLATSGKGESIRARVWPAGGSGFGAEDDFTTATSNPNGAYTATEGPAGDVVVAWEDSEAAGTTIRAAVAPAGSTQFADAQRISPVPTDPPGDNRAMSAGLDGSGNAFVAFYDGHAADTGAAEFRSGFGPPVAAGGPGITGGAQVGGTLHVSTGTWANCDAAQPCTYSYRWERCSSSTCLQIVGTDASYAVGAADAGYDLIACVTARNARGETDACASAGTIPSPAAPPAHQYSLLGYTGNQIILLPTATNLDYWATGGSPGGALDPTVAATLPGGSVVTLRYYCSDGGAPLNADPVASCAGSATNGQETVAFPPATRASDAAGSAYVGDATLPVGCGSTVASCTWHATVTAVVSGSTVSKTFTYSTSPPASLAANQAADVITGNQITQTLLPRLASALVTYKALNDPQGHPLVLVGSDDSIIAAGSGNVIGAGAYNVINAGSGNVINAGSGNLTPEAQAAVINAGSGNVINAGSGNIVARVLAPDGTIVGVIAAGAGNVINAGSGNVIQVAATHFTPADVEAIIAAGSGNVINAGSGNVIAAGAGNVIAAGAGNILSTATPGKVIGAGAYNLASAAASGFTGAIGNLSGAVGNISSSVSLAGATGGTGSVRAAASTQIATANANLLGRAHKVPVLMKLTHAGGALLRGVATQNARLAKRHRPLKQIRVTVRTRFKPPSGKTVTITKTVKLTPRLPKKATHHR